MDKQYRRTIHLLKTQDMIEQDPRCRYLAASCLAEIKDWEECLCMLGGWEDDEVMANLKKMLVCSTLILPCIPSDHAE